MRAASTFSLLLLLVAVAVAGPYTDLNQRLQAQTNPAKALRTIRDARRVLGPNPRLDTALRAAVEAEDDASRKEAVNRAVAIVQLEAVAERVSPASDVQSTIREIKAKPLYSDPGVKDQSNWLSNALERLRNLRFNWKPPESKVKTPPSIVGDWLVYLMWTVLAVLVAFFVWLVLRHVKWKINLSRKATALLEEDEPERTVDEWLQRADQLAAEGRHREAVRCLYLACLLKFDEARVARFDRGQTNWEHLGRIQASARLPQGLDFLPATKSFDRVWYGKQVRGMEDVEAFRAWYSEISGALMARAA
jgi:hypothetical protein